MKNFQFCRITEKLRDRLEKIILRSDKFMDINEIVDEKISVKIIAAEGSSGYVEVTINKKGVKKSAEKKKDYAEQMKKHLDSINVKYVFLRKGNNIKHNEFYAGLNPKQIYDISQRPYVEMVDDDTPVM